MKTNSAILTIGPWHDKPWWWNHIKGKINGCRLLYVRIPTKKNRKEPQLTFADAPRLTIKIIKVLRKYKPSYVFTFECGWASMLVATLQTCGFMRSIKHIILQFIMREKEPTLRSRLKFFFMRLILSSINIAVCSSTGEVSYYREVFNWEEGRTRFVPFHTDPKFLEVPLDENEGYILTAGRTFRDYKTFFDAVREIDQRVIVVASPWNINKNNIPKNVSIKYDITITELTDLIRNCSIVVIPLDDKKISIGQSVFLQAMAMRKTVVVTKTAGTIDYIDHFENGMLVPPRDSSRMFEAIQYLINNENERFRIGRNAKQSVLKSHLPQHYYQNVRRLIIEEEKICEDKRLNINVKEGRFK